MSQVMNSKFLRKASAVAVIAAGLVFAGCSEMISRDDFATRVKDKSDTEVTKLVGKPSTVDTSAPNQVTWTYTSRTFNIQDGNKFDSKAVVVFSKASTGGPLRVMDVKFE